MGFRSKVKKSTGQTTELPRLSAQHYGSVNLLGGVFLFMAVCQLLSFEEFQIVLVTIGLSSDIAWAVILILAELLAAVGFFKLRLSHALRIFSAISAILVSGFWFVQNIKLISEGLGGLLPNIGFFGSYLAQSPGWWTTLQTTVLILWVLYSLNLMRSSLSLKPE